MLEVGLSVDDAMVSARIDAKALSLLNDPLLLLRNVCQSNSRYFGLENVSAVLKGVSVTEIIDLVFFPTCMRVLSTLLLYGRETCEWAKPYQRQPGPQYCRLFVVVGP